MFDQVHSQFEPMIFHILKKLGIYQNRQEFYQIGCIDLWEASLRYDENKGEFSSYAYSYIIDRMKTELSNERKFQEKCCQLVSNSDQNNITEDDLSLILTGSYIDSIATHLTPLQRKWLKAYCLHGKTPSEIAKEEGVSISAVKAWRRDGEEMLLLN
jgi:DNA-directed RNA polymerase